MSKIIQQFKIFYTYMCLYFLLSGFTFTLIKRKVLFTGTKQDIFSVIIVYWFYWILCLFYFPLQQGPGQKHALFLLPFDPTGLHGPHWPDELHGLHWPHCAAGLASVVWRVKDISAVKVRIKIVHFIFLWCFLFEISQRSDSNENVQWKQLLHP